MASVTAKSKIEQAEKIGRALKLRKEGRSLQYIADDLGLKNENAAFTLITNHLKKLKLENADEVLKIELARLDELLLKLQPGIERGGTSAISGARKIVELKVRLAGLITPYGAKIKHTSSGKRGEETHELKIIFGGEKQDG